MFALSHSVGISMFILNIVNRTTGTDKVAPDKIHGMLSVVAGTVKTNVEFDE